MLFLGVKPKVSHKWFRKTICSVDIILRWGCSQLDFKNRFATAHVLELFCVQFSSFVKLFVSEIQRNIYRYFDEIQNVEEEA